MCGCLTNVRRIKSTYIESSVILTHLPTVAVTMYEGMGYTVFRRVKDYYSGGVQPAEDAFGELVKHLEQPMHC